MRKILILLLLITLVGCQKNTPIVEDETITEYNLDVRLDETNNRLYVEGDIVYFNSAEELDELYLKLFPNAYTVTDREQNVVIDYIKINDQVVTYVISGPDNTTIHLDLENSLEVDESATISFSYYFNYWDIDRILVVEDYYLTMFFYPFVAQYNDEGWNLDEYSFRGESYHNAIGNYNVSIDLQEDFVLGSSGKVINTIENGNRTIYEIELKKGRDFSFSASKDYYLFEEEIDGRDIKILSTSALSSSELQLSFDTIENSIEFYSNIIGEYEYDYFTLELGHYYGMESSGIIYCSEDLNEVTIVHEIVHQWFYSMIGNDQADEPWLDEGLTTFATGLYFDEYPGDITFDGYFEWYNPFSSRVHERYLLYNGNSALRGISEYTDDYGYIVYYHGASILKYFTEEFLDDDYHLVYNIFRQYYDNFYGEVASIDDFLDILSSYSDDDDAKEFMLMHLGEFQNYGNRP